MIAKLKMGNREFALKLLGKMVMFDLVASINFICCPVLREKRSLQLKFTLQNFVKLLQ